VIQTPPVYTSNPVSSHKYHLPRIASISFSTLCLLPPILHYNLCFQGVQLHSLCSGPSTVVVVLPTVSSIHVISNHWIYCIGVYSSFVHICPGLFSIHPIDNFWMVIRRIWLILGVLLWASHDVLSINITFLSQILFGFPQPGHRVLYYNHVVKGS
jgi:hypothetical protein